jgi:hypothetical protein
MGKKGSSGSRGIALLEVMFAACVLTITLGGVVGGVRAIEHTSAVASEKRAAVAEFASIMDAIRQISASQIFDTDPDRFFRPKSGLISIAVRDKDGAFVALPLAPEKSRTDFPVPLDVRVGYTDDPVNSRWTLSARALLVR